MPAYEPSRFLERLILSLMPYLVAITPDQASARSEILETIVAYSARTRSEGIHTSGPKS